MGRAHIRKVWCPPQKFYAMSGKCRMVLQIATWNDRGGMEQKIYELLDVIDNRDLGVICVTETMRKRNDKIALR